MWSEFWAQWRPLVLITFLRNSTWFDDSLSVLITTSMTMIDVDFPPLSLAALGRTCRVCAYRYLNSIAPSKLKTRPPAASCNYTARWHHPTTLRHSLQPRLPAVQYTACWLHPTNPATFHPFIPRAQRYTRISQLVSCYKLQVVPNPSSSCLHQPASQLLSCRMCPIHHRPTTSVHRVASR